MLYYNWNYSWTVNDSPQCYENVVLHPRLTILAFTPNTKRLDGTTYRRPFFQFQILTSKLIAYLKCSMFTSIRNLPLSQKRKPNQSLLVTRLSILDMLTDINGINCSRIKEAAVLVTSQRRLGTCPSHCRGSCRGKAPDFRLIDWVLKSIRANYGIRRSFFMPSNETQ